MSLLSYTQICDLIEDGVIEGADYKRVNSASLDLTLGKIIQEERNPVKDIEGWKPHIISLAKRESPHFGTINLESQPNKSYVLKPGQFILAHTAEIFHLPNDVSCEYKLKSSMARMGLEHLNAGWCDAGWNGSVLTLELRNMLTYHDIEITLGDKIGQMIFFSHAAVPQDKSYAARGSYNGDKVAQPTRKEKSQ
jgi:dCTP deaminase